MYANFAILSESAVQGAWPIYTVFEPLFTCLFNCVNIDYVFETVQ